MGKGPYLYSAPFLDDVFSWEMGAIPDLTPERIEGMTMGGLAGVPPTDRPSLPSPVAVEMRCGGRSRRSW